MSQPSLTQADVDLLNSLGCLPPVDAVPRPTEYGNLAPGLVDLWAEWRRIAPRSRRNRAARIESWLRASVECGAVLSVQTCEQTAVSTGVSLDGHALFWPRGVPGGRRIGLAASRLPRSLEARQPAYSALRSIIARAPESGQPDVFVTTGQSPIADGVVRCCELFHRPLMKISCADTASATRHWLDHLATQSRPGQSRSNEWPVFVSPDLRRVKGSRHDESPSPAGPDVALAGLSEQIVLVSLRRGGNWDALARVRLGKQAADSGSVRIVAQDGLCSNDLMRELQSLGAIPWLLAQVQPTASAVSEPVVHEMSLLEQEILQSVRSAHEGDDTWLTHWTRRVDAPWPGESKNELLDALIFDLPEADHTALATLVRIVSEGGLRATGDGQRKEHRSVSFSALPLRLLVSERTFRAHRGRWDFEHFGICIRRKLLERAGARPVIYGDDAIWSDLPEGERPWFQPRFSTSASAALDWSAEREWRIAHHVDLSRLRSQDAFLYCPSNAEAAVLRGVSDWPVLTVDALLDG